MEKTIEVVSYTGESVSLIVTIGSHKDGPSVYHRTHIVLNAGEALQLAADLSKTARGVLQHETADSET